MRCVHIVVCAKAACGEVGVRFRRQAVLTRVGIRGSIVVTSNPMRMMGVKSGGTSRGASISPICQKGGEKPSQGKEALGVYVCICVCRCRPPLCCPSPPFPSCVLFPYMAFQTSPCTLRPVAPLRCGCAEAPACTLCRPLAQALAHDRRRVRAARQPVQRAQPQPCQQCSGAHQGLQGQAGCVPRCEARLRCTATPASAEPRL